VTPVDEHEPRSLPGSGGRSGGGEKGQDVRSQAGRQGGTEPEEGNEKKKKKSIRGALGFCWNRTRPAAELLSLSLVWCGG